MNTRQKFFSFALYCAVTAVTFQPATSFGEEKKPEAKPQATAPVAAPAAAQPSRGPLAKVNGTAITSEEVDRAVKVFLAQNRSPQPPTPDQIKQLHDAALEQMIAAEMLFQAGQKLGIKDIDKQADQKISESRARFRTQEEFEKALKNSGLTEQELRELTRKDIVIKGVVDQQVADKIAITDKDVEKFYNENLDKFKQEAGVKASHILIGVDEKAGAEQKKQAREKADGVLKKIKAGGDFAALAKENSTCPSSAQGGDLGFFGKGQMVPPFEKAAFSLKPGEVSDVVETQFGYHIIKLTDKKEAETAKLAEVKPKIQEFLKNQKLQQAVGEYLNELKGTMKIERISSSK